MDARRPVQGALQLCSVCLPAAGHLRSILFSPGWQCGLKGWAAETIVICSIDRVRPADRHGGLKCVSCWLTLAYGSGRRRSRAAKTRMRNGLRYWLQQVCQVGRAQRWPHSWGAQVGRCDGEEHRKGHQGSHHHGGRTRINCPKKFQDPQTIVWIEGSWGLI